METRQWRTGAWEYGLPALLLIGSLIVMGLIWDDVVGFWGMTASPLVAFLIGVIVRPRHAWVTPVVVTALMAATVFISGALGWLEYDLPVIGWVLGTLAAFGVAVGGVETLMIWTGRTIGQGVARRFGHNRPPHAPVT